MQHSASNLRRRLGGLLYLTWTGLVIAVFILVMIPPESGLAQSLPEGYWQLREIIFPWFSSQSVYN
jgi:hypothetical protein